MVVKGRKRGTAVKGLKHLGNVTPWEYINLFQHFGNGQEAAPQLLDGC